MKKMRRGDAMRVVLTAIAFLLFSPQKRKELRKYESRKTRNKARGNVCG